MLSVKSIRDLCSSSNFTLTSSNGISTFTYVSLSSGHKRIYHGEEIHERGDFTQKDLDAFLDSLNTKQFADIQNFFETMPKLVHNIEFQNPNTKKKHKKTLEGLGSFFA